MLFWNLQSPFCFSLIVPRRRTPLSVKRTTRSTRAKTSVKAGPLKKAPAKKPAKPRVKAPAPAASVKLLKFILKSLDADKAEDIATIDMSGKSPMADFMVVATGRSSRHVAAIAEHVTEALKKDGLKCRVEGLQQGDWVLIDAVDVIIHVFRPEVREFYNLEKMWGGSETLTAAS